MSCGTKITGMSWGWSEREEIADKLERDGESWLADKVRHEQCLGFMDLHRAEDALERQGMMRHFDYREERCHCHQEEEEDRG